jgi:hypothetical protein
MLRAMRTYSTHALEPAVRLGTASMRRLSRLSPPASSRVAFLQNVGQRFLAVRGQMVTSPDGDRWRMLASRSSWSPCSTPASASGEPGLRQHPRQDSNLGPSD